MRQDVEVFKFCYWCQVYIELATSTRCKRVFSFHKPVVNLVRQEKLLVQETEYRIEGLPVWNLDVHVIAEGFETKLFQHRGFVFSVTNSFQCNIAVVHDRVEFDRRLHVLVSIVILKRLFDLAPTFDDGCFVFDAPRDFDLLAFSINLFPDLACIAC